MYVLSRPFLVTIHLGTGPVLEHSKQIRLAQEAPSGDFYLNDLPCNPL